jgi:acetyltransferase
VAFAVADDWQGRGVGRVLVDRLAADARAAGITRFRATVTGENPRSLALLRRLRAQVACA